MAQIKGTITNKAHPGLHIHEETLWTYEQSLAGSASRLAGVDEAGRGALAGPVVAAAVILGGDVSLWSGIDDSKKLSKRKREQLSHHIRTHAVAVGVGMASVEEIDIHNILHASRIAMGRALANLKETVQVALVDGPYVPLFTGQAVPSIPVIDGDAKCLSIAAASIVAKVERDTYMERLGDMYSGYAFHQNAGYGTPAHLDALEKLGPTPVHRTSFAPVRRHLQVRLDL